MTNEEWILPNQLQDSVESHRNPYSKTYEARLSASLDARSLAPRNPLPIHSGGNVRLPRNDAADKNVKALRT